MRCVTQLSKHVPPTKRFPLTPLYKKRKQMKVEELHLSFFSIIYALLSMLRRKLADFRFTHIILVFLRKKNMVNDVSTK